MKIFFLSLGCDKNLCDSEHMIYRLSKKGYEFTDDESDADIIIINTCAFIGDAKEESINEILRLSSYKEEGRCRAVIACGCLAERYQEEILKEIPELDGVLGTASFDQIEEVVEKALMGEKKEVFFDNSRMFYSEGRVVTTPGGYGYLKIAEGCDKNCTYCIIPSLRGRYRSFSMEKLEEEARDMAEKGVRELILVAQETTLYGTDLYGYKALPELLKRLSAIPDIEWIRLTYCYPEEINDELIACFSSLPKLVPYLDIPIQHASDHILKRMNRRTNQKELLETIEKLRKNIPDLTLRTTLIAGFPGETEEDHEELKRFIEKVRFERLGVFSYSREEGTPAAEFEDQVPDEIKDERRDRLMEIQQEIVFSEGKKRVGKILSCIIEGELPAEDEGPVYAGRTVMDAPDVDGMIFIYSDDPLMTGDIVKVKITASEGYDLIGEKVV